MPSDGNRIIVVIARRQMTLANNHGGSMFHTPFPLNKKLRVKPGYSERKK